MCNGCLHGIRAEHIQKRSRQNGCAASSSFKHIKAEIGKAKACTVHSEQHHKHIKILHIADRHKDCRQVKRVPDHVVMKGGNNIRPIPDTEAPFRYDKLMFKQQRLHNRSQPLGVVAQRIVMLQQTVSIVNEGLMVYYEIAVNRSRQYTEYPCVLKKIFSFSQNLHSSSSLLWHDSLQLL